MRPTRWSGNRILSQKERRDLCHAVITKRRFTACLRALSFCRRPESRSLLDAEANGVSIILRGSILDLYNEGNLPTDPEPRLLDLGIGATQWSDGGGFTIGAITRIHRVPEPGTIALLGIGLLGMGSARRRTSHPFQPLAKPRAGPHYWLFRPF